MQFPGIEIPGIGAKGEFQAGIFCGEDDLFLGDVHRGADLEGDTAVLKETNAS